jgi:hypothetical protein
MMAYEFYCRNGTGEIYLVGILPERRKNPERITQKSIMNFGKMLIGDNAGPENIYFIQVAFDDHTGEMHLTNASSMT